MTQIPDDPEKGKEDDIHGDLEGYEKKVDKELAKEEEEAEEDAESDFLDAVVSGQFSDGLVNHADNYDLKCQVFDLGEIKSSASKIISDWANECDKNGILITRSVQESLAVGDKLVVWYYEIADDEE